MRKKKYPFYFVEIKENSKKKKERNIYRKFSVRINSSLNALLSLLYGSVTNCFNYLMAIKKNLFSVILRIHCVLHVVGCIDKHSKIVKINK